MGSDGAADAAGGAGDYGDAAGEGEGSGCSHWVSSHWMRRESHCKRGLGGNCRRIHAIYLSLPRSRA